VPVAGRALPPLLLPFPLLVSCGLSAESDRLPIVEQQSRASPADWVPACCDPPVAGFETEVHFQFEQSD
jgi:hypothetical protein